MNIESSFAGSIEVPESVLIKREQANKYGRVPGLNDSELLGPAELERLYYQQEWGPVLALPRPQNSTVWHAADGDGVDFGAFGTVDFSRTIPEFDKLRYKADKIREQVKERLIMVGIVSERLSGKAKYLVMKYLYKGIIGLEHIVNPDMLALAKLCLRVQRMQAEIEQLERIREARRLRRAEQLFGG